MKFLIFLLFFSFMARADEIQCPASLVDVLNRYQHLNSNFFGEVELGNGYMVFHHVDGQEIGEIKAIQVETGVVEMDLIFVNEAFRGRGAQEEMYQRMLEHFANTSGAPIRRVNMMTSLSMTNQKVFLQNLAQRAGISFDPTLSETALESLLMHPPHVDTIMNLPQNVFEEAFRATPKARSMARLGFSEICTTASSFRLSRNLETHQLRLKVDLCR